jgi:hypothetical protein
MVRASEQRASDSERDEIIDLLRTAAGEGRIDHDELDERVARALTARTYRELNATIQDIPRSRGARTPVTRGRVGGWAVRAVRNEPWLLLFVVPVLAMTLALAVTVAMMWMVVALAMLALGGHPRDPTRLISRDRRPQVPRAARRLAGSAWRWI